MKNDKKISRLDYFELLPKQDHDKQNNINECERTVLNLLSRMSGIATQTNILIKKIHGNKTKLYATRKTAPGLRFFDKEAVKIGGG